MQKVLVLNGPNLGRLGSREPDIYGAMDFDALTSAVNAKASQIGLIADVRQTDSESELIKWIHEAVDTGANVILNPAAFTHYSYGVDSYLLAMTQLASR